MLFKNLKVCQKFFLKCLLIIIFLLLISINSFSKKIDGIVIGVTDGDTITVLDNNKKIYKVRLSNIDAPEKKQDFGIKSKQSLSNMVYKKHVQINYKKTDKYGRIIGDVYRNKNNVNLQQIKNGMAWTYLKYSNDNKYKVMEKIAKDNRKGLWSSKNPIAPWDYRKKKYSKIKTKKHLYRKNNG